MLRLLLVVVLVVREFVVAFLLSVLFPLDVVLAKDFVGGNMAVFMFPSHSLVLSASQLKVKG